MVILWLYHIHYTDAYLWLHHLSKTDFDQTLLQAGYTEYARIIMVQSKIQPGSDKKLMIPAKV